MSKPKEPHPLNEHCSLCGRKRVVSSVLGIGGIRYSACPKCDGNLAKNMR